MKFYRLEKENYFKTWTFAILKAVAIGLILTVLVMLAAGYKFMIVSSGSMEPTLPVGSLVIVTPCDYDDLQYGDIVTMDANGINLTHRVVGKYNSTNPEKSVIVPEGEQFEGEYWKTVLDEAVTVVADSEGFDSEEWWVTKGDNSNTLDGRLDDGIVGKVYENHAWSWLGTAVRYVRANFRLCVIMLVLVVAFISVIEWLKSKMEVNDIEVYDTDEE